MLPGLFEEVCFRAGIQNILTRWFKGPWLAIILTAIIFSCDTYFLLWIFSALCFRDYTWDWYFITVVVYGFPYSFIFYIMACRLQHCICSIFPEQKIKKILKKTFPLWAGVVALCFHYLPVYQIQANFFSSKSKNC